MLARFHFTFECFCDILLSPANPDLSALFILSMLKLRDLCDANFSFLLAAVALDLMVTRRQTIRLSPIINFLSHKKLTEAYYALRTVMNQVFGIHNLHFP